MFLLHLVIILLVIVIYLGSIPTVVIPSNNLSNAVLGSNGDDTHVKNY